MYRSPACSGVIMAAPLSFTDAESPHHEVPHVVNPHNERPHGFIPAPAGLGWRFSPARHGTSQRPRAEASLRALAVSVASRRTGRPAEPGIRPAGRDARVPAGWRFPAERSAPADPSAPTVGAGPRERLRNTVRTRRGPLPPQRSARQPSADRTMHSSEKHLLSNSKSLRSP